MKFVFALLSLLGMSSANAVVYDFSGSIDTVFSNPTDGGIGLGTKFSGYLDYDTDALIPAGSDDFYFNAVRGYEFSLGSHTYSNPTGSGMSLFANGTSATLEGSGVTTDTSSIFVDDVGFHFAGVSGLPPTLDHFDSARFSIALFLPDPSNPAGAEGAITSFAKRISVPEPSTYGLFILGFLGVLLGARHRRRSSDERVSAVAVAA